MIITNGKAKPKKSVAAKLRRVLQLAQLKRAELQGVCNATRTITKLNIPLAPRNAEFFERKLIQLNRLLSIAASLSMQL